MKLLLFWILACVAIGTARAEEPVPAMSAGELLDQAIHWPGDYKQLCADNEWDENPPPLRCYGLSWGIAMPYYLSDRMKGLLHAQRDAVVREMASRFAVFDWMKPPPITSATKVPKVPLKVYTYPPNYDGPAAPMPTEPTGDNPRGVGQLMLSIASELKAVETLPGLLRVEEQLHQILEKASASDVAPLPEPDFELAGYYNQLAYLSVDEAETSELKKKVDRAQRIFRGRLMDAQILGVMLELLREKNYAPLEHSVFERTRLRDALYESRSTYDLKEIHRAEDLPKDQPWLRFDKKLGFAYNPERSCHFPFTREARDEILALVLDYLSGKVSFVEPSGDALLDEAVRFPGSYSQVCSFATAKVNANETPLPAYGLLLPREYQLGEYMAAKLLTYRDKVVPVAIARLKAIDFTHLPAPHASFVVRSGMWETGMDPHALSGLFLSVLQVTRATEALPELLRLEEQLHKLAIDGMANNDAPLPVLDADYSYALIPSSKESSRNEKITEERKGNLYKIQVMDHEILGVMAGLLRKERYSPLLGSQLEKDYIAGLRKIADQGALQGIKRAKDIPLQALPWVRFDHELNIPVYRQDSTVELRYTEARREEICHMVHEFLATILPQDWSGPAAPAL